MNIKKYTIVYSEYFQKGSHSHSIVSYKKIETDSDMSKDIKDILEKHDICTTQVHFIFEGHVQNIF
jgi:hypothetical protein